MNGHRQTTPTCPFCADIVEELGAQSWRRSNGPARRRRGRADRTSGRRGSGEPLRSAAVPSECRSRCQPATCGQAVRDQLNQRYRSASTAKYFNKICHQRTFDSAKRSHPTHSDKQVGQNRKNSHLRGEPTDWPYTWRAEGVGGNIKEPGDNEHPSPNYRQ